MATDLDLLDQYARRRSEDAFAALVQRHLGLVFSAALRRVRSRQLAEEVAQSVFSDLAQNALRLKPDTILAAWLYQVTRRKAIDVVRRESRRQLREQIATEMNAWNSRADTGGGSQPVWADIEALFDEAMDALDQRDRSAILLRYFENKSLREVGQALRSSEDAAQKRVRRAVERLRDFLLKRGVTVGASGLAAGISANAVQAAPGGLAATISTAAALAGPALTTAATAAVTKTIAMTTLQKTLVAATFAAALSTGIYQARQASNLRTQVQILQRQQTALTESLRQWQRKREVAAGAIAALQKENDSLRSGAEELAKLRGELARVRAGAQERAQPNPGTLDMSDPFTRSIVAMTARAVELNQHLEQMPDKRIPELQLLTENDWLNAAKDAKFDTEADIRKALGKLRNFAKDRLPMGSALHSFMLANDGRLPNEISQLRPYFKSILREATPDDATLDAIFARYKLLHSGSMSDLAPDAWIVAESAPADKDYDTLALFGNGFSTSTRP